MVASTSDHCYSEGPTKSAVIATAVNMYKYIYIYKWGDAVGNLSKAVAVPTAASLPVACISFECFKGKLIFA